MIINGKVYGREAHIVIDTGSCSTIVRPDLLPAFCILPSEKNYVLETANGETIPVIGIHEAKFQLGQTVICHKVFVAEILDDVLFGLDIIQKYEFRLNLRQRTLVINDEEILMAISGQNSIRKLMKKEDTVLPLLNLYWTKTTKKKIHSLSNLKTIELEMAYSFLMVY